MYFRDHQGGRRRSKAVGRTKAAAKRALTQSVDAALRAGGEFRSSTTLGTVADEWLRGVGDLVSRGARSPTTYDVYARTLRVHVLPSLGELRISEFTPGRFDRFLSLVQSEHGYATAKLCRTVLSGVCALLVRRDALPHNPVRDVSNMERSRRPAERRVLTPADALRWLAVVDSDAYAVPKDLPDLVRLLLATGMRLGEALALDWDDVDLERHVVRVEATIVRVQGKGLLRKTTKSATSQRVLLVPVWCVAMLRGRRDASGGRGPVFPDSVGGWRDRNNVSRDRRMVRAGTEFEWFVSHTARRTVATLLDENGLTARSIADQLGHARVSMTQDVYMGRRLPRADIARSLDTLFDDQAG